MAWRSTVRHAAIDCCAALPAPPPDGCICAYTPTMHTLAQFWLLIHPDEYRKPTNTARLIGASMPHTRFFPWYRTAPPAEFIALLTDRRFMPYLLIPQGDVTLFERLRERPWLPRECRRSYSWMARGVKPPRCCTGVRICRAYPGWPFNLAPLPPTGCAANVMRSICPLWKWLLHSWNSSKRPRPVVSCTPIFVCLLRGVWPRGTDIRSKTPCQKWRNSSPTIKHSYAPGHGERID